MARAATACSSDPHRRRPRLRRSARASRSRAPAGYIAQPTLALSACPTFVEAGIAPRHIDLRPFVLSGKTVTMVAGGLTRVALQGKARSSSIRRRRGGTKDTWMVD